MFPVASCRGRLCASGAPTLPTANLIFALTADPAYCKRSAGGQTSTVDGTVGAWYDRITGTLLAEQQTNTSRPTLRLLNGQYWIQGDGIQQIMGCSAAFDVDTYDSGLSIYYRQIFSGDTGDGNSYLIGRYVSTTGNWFWGKGNAGATMNIGLPVLSGYVVADRTGATVSAGTADSFAQIWTPGSDVTIYKNGTQVNQVTGVGSTVGTGRYCLFGHNGDITGGGAQFWNGYCRHLFVYNAVHNSTQRADVLAALAT